MKYKQAHAQATGWALGMLARAHPERFRSLLMAGRSELEGSCLTHRMDACPNPGEHVLAHNRLDDLVRARARRALAKQEDLREEFLALREGRKRGLLDGTAVKAEHPVKLAAERLKASRGEWGPVKHYDHDGRGLALDYASRIRLGQGLNWQPRGDFEAEVRRSESGDGWTVWAVWLGDGDE